ncbi:MAG: class I SAM-dependent methyltransferase [Actinomycetota bacterium]
MSTTEEPRRAEGLDTASRLACCPACESTKISHVHTPGRVPAHSCLLLRDQQEAKEFPTGELEVWLCEDCGFVFNPVFEVELNQYSTDFEESQGFSPTFVEFGKGLAEQWVRDYDLEGKSAIEIGCGKGEFLEWMVEAGLGSGVGIDPGIQVERFEPGGPADRIEWKVDHYDASYGPFAEDAVVCRHTLEHIAPVKTFMDDVRRSIGEREHVAVLFELPDVVRVLDEGAFWDVYYEHCSYFSPGSLARLFRRTGYEVLAVERCYSDQYLLIEARPADGPTEGKLPLEEDPAEMKELAERYAKAVTTAIDGWRDKIAETAARGGKTAIWGAGSKGVAFLHGVGETAPIEAAIDINPFKHDTFIAGSGHPVVAPEWLQANPVDLIVCMNPVYVDEITAQVRELGLPDCEIVAV